MHDLHHKRRWVFGPLTPSGTPLAGEYSLRHTSMLAHNGKSMSYCEFNAHGLAAARACPELIVLGSIHDPGPIHGAIADHYGTHGVQKGMSQHDALVALAKHHPSFEPPD
jgi:hypothetical protein